jgi:HAMP domain-containing protein
MQTVTIKVNNIKALKLLEDLEALDLIEVIKKTVVKGKSKKLSDQLSGSITATEAKQMRKELKQMRSEWERNI